MGTGLALLAPLILCGVLLAGVALLRRLTRPAEAAEREHHDAVGDEPARVRALV